MYLKQDPFVNANHPTLFLTVCNFTLILIHCVSLELKHTSLKQTQIGYTPKQIHDFGFLLEMDNLILMFCLFRVSGVFFKISNNLCVRTFTSTMLLVQTEGKLLLYKWKGFFVVAMVSYKIKLHHQWLYVNFPLLIVSIFFFAFQHFIIMWYS